MEPIRHTAATGAVRVLLNPAAGRGAARRALPALERLAAEAEVPLVVSRDREELCAEAAAAVAAGAERLVVAGGDGTLHHVVQALAGQPTALGIVPMGSGNDLAATLGMPRQLRAAFRLALEGPVKELDLGRVWGRVQGPVADQGGGEPAARWFAGVAGVGFDSEVARTILEGGRRGGAGRLFRGSALYVYGVVRTLGSFRPPYLVLEHEEGRWEGPVMLVAFGNTHRFGGGMRIAPDAVPDDGLLDVVIVRKVAKPTLLRVFPRVYKGTHLSHPSVVTFRARRLTLRLDRPMTVFGDGEPMVPVGEEAVTVEVVPRALRVASPLP